jgi:hypothetical protein
MGYEDRVWPEGETWEQHLKDKLDGPLGLCCIIELIDHVIDESTRVYQETIWEKTFFIFHDGLSAWWEKGAQEYIAARGFRDRQWKCCHPTNAGTRYKDSVVGDSPEICRGLDSHGFADFKRSIQYHCSLSSAYDLDDPRRFKMGTPDEVWRTMRRCWTLVPTSDRIVEDINGFPRILAVIIAARGVVCSDESLRHGRRYLSVDGTKELKNKPRISQRANTMRQNPTHPHCIVALERILALCNQNLSEDSDKDSEIEEKSIYSTYATALRFIVEIKMECILHILNSAAGPSKWQKRAKRRDGTLQKNKLDEFDNRKLQGHLQKFNIYIGVMSEKSGLPRSSSR